MKNKKILILLTLSIILLNLISGIVGGVGGYFLAKELNTNPVNNVVESNVSNIDLINNESTIINVVEDVGDSVVSVIIRADTPKFSGFGYRSSETVERQIGSGSGFLISEDGLIVTNRHVVSNENAKYSVILSNGEEVEATVLARDTLLDIAFLDIEGNNYKPMQLGSSDDIKVGQTTIAIGNALGEFSNSVSTGIISGLKRNIIAGGSFGASQELISDVIQTDASINPGNSGGPLLDINGKVIGVNVAVAADSENIGFAIPIDTVKDLIERLNEKGEIQRPILGVRYFQVNEAIQDELDLEVNYGAIIISGNNDPAVVENSPADLAGIQEGDIILEIDGEKIEGKKTLQSLVQEKYIGDSITVLVLTEKGNEIEFDVELFEFQVN
ncbi:MAG: trypsin-like peptidase domain-containing protein [Candidatus Dojkabacteria bacterium]|nr:trypsin-like peptidase domain-containing protein [Candidatus Dojkabacteria bacterium]MDQ7020787.1 trypsin-like peptidase domain-containing protein [Candidatus Dojkabacteria bacterium]